MQENFSMTFCNMNYVLSIRFCRHHNSDLNPRIFCSIERFEKRYCRRPAPVAYLNASAASPQHQHLPYINLAHPTPPSYSPNHLSHLYRIVVCNMAGNKKNFTPFCVLVLFVISSACGAPVRSSKGERTQQTGVIWRSPRSRD